MGVARRRIEEQNVAHLYLLMRACVSNQVSKYEKLVNGSCAILFLRDKSAQKVRIEVKDKCVFEGRIILLELECLYSIKQKKQQKTKQLSLVSTNYRSISVYFSIYFLGFVSIFVSS